MHSMLTFPRTSCSVEYERSKRYIILPAVFVLKFLPSRDVVLAPQIE